MRHRPAQRRAPIWRRLRWSREPACCPPDRPTDRPTPFAAGTIVFEQSQADNWCQSSRCVAQHTPSRNTCCSLLYPVRLISFHLCGRPNSFAPAQSINQPGPSLLTRLAAASAAACQPAQRSCRACEKRNRCAAREPSLASISVCDILRPLGRFRADSSVGLCSGGNISLPIGAKLGRLAMN